MAKNLRTAKTHRKKLQVAGTFRYDAILILRGLNFHDAYCTMTLPRHPLVVKKTLLKHALPVTTTLLKQILTSCNDIGQVCGC
jgi:hypothetical protein